MENVSNIDLEKLRKLRSVLGGSVVYGSGSWYIHVHRSEFRYLQTDWQTDGELEHSTTERSSRQTKGAETSEGFEKEDRR